MNAELRFDSRWIAFADSKNIHIFPSRELKACYILHQGIKFSQSEIILHTMQDCEITLSVNDTPSSEALFLELYKLSTLYQESSSHHVQVSSSKISLVDNVLIYENDKIIWINTEAPKSSQNIFTYDQEQLALGFQCFDTDSDGLRSHYIYIFMDDKTHFNLFETFSCIRNTCHSYIL